MNNKIKNLKTGNENSVIIIILAILIVVVLGIVGIMLAKDTKIATFDGGALKKSEYKAYYNLMASTLQMYGYDQSQIPMNIANRAAVDKMILVDAKKANVKVEDDQKKEIEELFANEQYVQYYKNLGIDLDSLRNLVYESYIIENYIKQLGEEASAEDIQNYINSKYDEGEAIDMNEYDTSHILFSFTDDQGKALSDEDKAALKEKAQAVLQRALAGEDFATLAKENSDDTTASEGGQYKMYMDGNTVEGYSDAVMKLEVGQIYPELVETEYGYHIIKLNAKNENGRVNSESEREEYANTLFDDIATTKNLVIDEELVDSFTREIDPDAYTENNNSTNTNTTTTTTTDTTTDSGNTIVVNEDGTTVEQ